MTADGACDNCGASPEKYTTSPSPPTSLVGQLGDCTRQHLPPYFWRRPVNKRTSLSTSAGIRSPGRARRRTRTRTHAAEHLSAHLHPVRACAAHPACPPSERSVRIRRGREGGGASHLRTRTHSYMRRNVPPPARRVRISGHTPARSPPTRYAPDIPHEALWCGIWRCHALCPAATRTCVTLSITLFKRRRSALRCAFPRTADIPRTPYPPLVYYVKF